MGISDEFRKLLTTVINGNYTKEELKKKLTDMITLSSPEEISEGFRQGLLNFVKFDLTKDQLLNILEILPAKNKDGDADKPMIQNNKSNIPSLQYEKPPTPVSPEKITKNTEKMDIIVVDVHRNEQENVAALCEGLQTILCSKLDHGPFYALVPQEHSSAYYTLSDDGRKYQSQIQKDWGKKMERFPRIYGAQVFAYSDLTNNSVLFWSDMKIYRMFKYWTPESPQAWCEHKLGRQEVQMLRVYKVDRDLATHISKVDGQRWPLIWADGSVCCQGIPVLTDQQMEKQYSKFNEILKSHDMPSAVRLH